jgi:hypothetical protein
LCEAAENGEYRPDFVPIPYAVFSDPTLSHAAKLVLGRLKLHVGKNDDCRVRHKTLACEVCLSVSQLKIVLKELRRAGWIDWRRTRSSSVYTVFPDRQKTAYIDGQKTGYLNAKIAREPAIRSPENQLSRSPENRLQKRSIEKKNENKPAPPPLSGQRPPVQLTEYPLATAAVRRRFAIADLVIVGRIVDACAQTYLSVDNPRIDPPGDAEFAAAIDRAAEETNGQNSPALFLRTAPRVIESWARYGRDAPPRRAIGRQAAIDAVWEEVVNGPRQE